MQKHTFIMRATWTVAVLVLGLELSGCGLASDSSAVHSQTNSSPHNGISEHTNSFSFAVTIPSIDDALAHKGLSTFITTSPKSNAGPPKDLRSVYFINANVGYGVTGDATNEKASLLHTKDGGHSWSVVGHWPGDFSYLSWSGDIGVATGQVLSGQDGLSVELAVTTDDGNSWKFLKPHIEKATVGSTAGFAELYAHVTANHDIWLLSSPEAATTGNHAPVWISHNEGKAFQQVSLPTGYVATGGFSAHNGYVALTVLNTKSHRSRILVGDGKTSWAKLGPNSRTPIYAVDYTNSTQIYAGGGHFSKFGLQPAQEIWSLSPGNPLNSTVVLKRNIPPQKSYQPIVAMDINRRGQSYILTGGVTMGGNLPAPGPLFISKDGGYHVRQENVGGTSFNVNQSHVWVTGNDVGLEVSSDGGNSWRMEFQPSTLLAESVQFLNSQVGYVTTSRLGVYRTTDGGNQWTHLPIQAIPYGGQKLDFVTPTHVYRWSQTGIDESTDGGRSWRTIKTPALEQIDGFNALPGGVLELTGLPLPHTSNHPFHDDFLTSSDDGAHWTKVSDPFHTQDVKLDFTSPSQGFARAPQLSLIMDSHPASLYVTTDGGGHWRTVSEGMFNDDGSNSLSANASGIAIGGESGPSVGTDRKMKQVGTVLVANSKLNKFQAWGTGVRLPDSLSYLARDDIWMTANGRLFHSTDGGKTFYEVWIVH